MQRFILQNTRSKNNLALYYKYIRSHLFFAKACSVLFYVDCQQAFPAIETCVLRLAVKATLLHGCFSRLLNCTNGTKSRNALHVYIFLKIQCQYSKATFSEKDIFFIRTITPRKQPVVQTSI